MDPLRARRLLLHKNEIAKLQNAVMQQGLTLVPLGLYLNEKGYAKLDIAVAKGKKLYDKRDSIAKKDADRRMDRLVKSRNR